MVHLDIEAERHRLSAFVNGFLSGLGLILIIWGLASLVYSAARNASVYTGLILFGVAMFAGGGFREAYLWGKFSAQLGIKDKIPTKRTQPAAPSKPPEQPRKMAPNPTASQGQADPNRLTEEQIIEHPAETPAQETAHHPQEQQTHA